MKNKKYEFVQSCHVGDGHSQSLTLGKLKGALIFIWISPGRASGARRQPRGLSEVDALTEAGYHPNHTLSSQRQWISLVLFQSQ